MFFKTSDFRYLLWLDDKKEMNNLPEVDIDMQSGNKIYKEIIKSYEKIDSSLQNLIIDMLKSFIRYIGNKNRKNEMSYNNNF